MKAPKPGTIQWNGSACTLFFAYDGPDLEWQFDANENPIQPGGQSLAVALSEGLASTGIQTSAVNQHSYFGWSFTTVVTPYRIYHVANCVGRHAALTCHFKGPLSHIILRKKRHRFQEEYLRRLIDELSSIPSTFRLPQESQIS
ncbi:hypothetical protein [Leptonema illini]|uniref:Uncharacterized protein n=1 Tax=Leptonema illini DSM 21528 TaxID=929563 RepID=H2CGX9_9LEPT|nr:hypothetical protein [Leptonema illini]EHQ05821.1 hypothetical protein Lepil_1126 [Leptonema illini DSM 21528]